jgi:release factor glutamine methyltransferase
VLRDTAVALTAAGIDNARFEARLLLAHASGLSTEELISHGRDPAPAAVADALRTLTARRLKREPVAYILGEREFWGLPFKVSPAVLVPRPDSETVIEAAIGLLPDRTRPLRLLDLGVGSGCLLLTLLREYPKAQGVGLEASPGALAVARENAAVLGVEGRVCWVEGDWRQPDWDLSVEGPFDLIVSNPPYIKSDTVAGLMPEVARFEPRLALDGGVDGLDAYREIAARVLRLMAVDGRVLVEVGEGQVSAVAGLLAQAGLDADAPWNDLGGIERVVVAHNKGLAIQNNWD